MGMPTFGQLGELMVESGSEYIPETGALLERLGVHKSPLELRVPSAKKVMVLLLLTGWKLPLPLPGSLRTSMSR
jgi:hypothetical protein